MIENIAELFPAWSIIPLSVACPAGLTKVLGSDAKRWIVYFQVPPAVIATGFLIPWDSAKGLQFNLGTMTVPLRFSQKDDGPLVCGDWFINNTGGAFNLTIFPLVWNR